jgi:hypothetical protein
MTISIRKIVETIARLLGTIMLSGIVAAMVSGYMTDLSNVKLENSRLANSQRLKIIESFDAAHAEVLSKLTLFNLDVLSGKKIDAARRAEVLQSIVKAELVATDIESALPPDEKKLVEDYKRELANISEQVQSVEQPLALGGIFSALLHLLPLRDKIATDARANLKMEGLF